MNIKRLLLIVIVFITAVSLPDITSGKDVVEGIPLSQVPKMVTGAAKKAVPGIRLLDGKIIKKDDGQILYLLEGVVGQKVYEVMVDSEGNVPEGGLEKEIKRDIPIANIPGNMILEIREEVKGFKLLKAKIVEGKDGGIIYELEGAADQNLYIVRFKEDGFFLGAKIINKSSEMTEIKGKED